MFSLSKQITIEGGQYLRNIFPATNGSIVVHLSRIISRISMFVIIHYSAMGECLWQFTKVGQIQFITMPRTNQLLYYDKHNKTLRVVNLDTHGMTEVPIMLKEGSAINYKVQYFSESDMLLLVGSYITIFPRMEELIYYEYQNFKKGREPIAVTQIPKQSTFRPLIKLDNHSKVATWHRYYKQNQPLKFICVSLDANKKVKVDNITATVGSELIRTEGFFGCFQIKNIQEKGDGAYNAEIAYDMAFKEVEYGLKTFLTFVSINTSKDSKIPLVMSYQPDWWKQGLKQLALTQTIGDETLRRYTFDVISQKGNLFEANQPLRYLNQLSENQIEIYVYTPTQQRVLEGIPCFRPNKIYVASWDSNIVALAGPQQEQKEVNGKKEYSLKIQVSELFTPLRTIYMHLLLSIHQDFDDDLLQDAVTYLTE